MFDEDQGKDKGSVGRGVGLTFLLHLLQLPMAFILLLIGPGMAYATVLFIGVSQAVYIVPALIYLKRGGETETMKGIIIMASITFLLNATCTVIVFSSLKL